MSKEHSTKCLRDACDIMGCQLISIQQFYHNAIIWLGERGKLTLQYFPGEGWSVVVENVVSSIGENLTEAICGAIHGMDGVGQRTAWDSLSDEAWTKLDDDPQGAGDGGER